jgi:hypothetical protein
MGGWCIASGMQSPPCSGSLRPASGMQSRFAVAHLQWLTAAGCSVPAGVLNVDLLHSKPRHGCAARAQLDYKRQTCGAQLPHRFAARLRATHLRHCALRPQPPYRTLPGDLPPLPVTPAGLARVERDAAFHPCGSRACRARCSPPGPPHLRADPGPPHNYNSGCCRHHIEHMLTPRWCLVCRSEMFRTCPPCPCPCSLSSRAVSKCRRPRSHRPPTPPRAPPPAWTTRRLCPWPSAGAAQPAVVYRTVRVRAHWPPYAPVPLHAGDDCLGRGRRPGQPRQHFVLRAPVSEKSRSDSAVAVAPTCSAAVCLLRGPPQSRCSGLRHCPSRCPRSCPRCLGFRLRFRFLPCRCLSRRIHGAVTALTFADPNPLSRPRVRDSACCGRDFFGARASGASIVVQTTEMMLALQC